MLCDLSRWNKYHNHLFPRIELLSQADQSSRILCVMGKYHGKCSHDDLSVGHRLRDTRLPLPVPGVSDSMVSSSARSPVSGAHSSYTDG
jgi:hypothetical protein